MAKIARAVKAALAIRSKGVRQIWVWKMYHQI
jgi:hypothetical protein